MRELAVLLFVALSSHRLRLVRALRIVPRPHPPFFGDSRTCEGFGFLLIHMVLFDSIVDSLASVAPRRTPSNTGCLLRAMLATHSTSCVPWWSEVASNFHSSGSGHWSQDVLLAITTTGA
ncbi:hypothetical protein HD554DRAFT_2136639 [Boletus coccyginus]|nr:hypothetical protein HD554DRAFT_2136639 [Boletus coccyginus]